MAEDRIVLEAERRQITGVSRTTAWRLEQKGEFPKRRKVSPGLVGWLESELRAWVNSRQAGPGRGINRDRAVA